MQSGPDGTANVSARPIDGTETLSRGECEHRLAGGGVGLLALPGDGAPILRPVNFLVHEGRIVLRTGEGRILEAARRALPASFAISEVDRFEHSGWSVVVTGKLAEQPALGASSAPAIRPWARAEKAHLVALSIDELSGRRIAERIVP